MKPDPSAAVAPRAAPSPARAERAGRADAVALALAQQILAGTLPVGTQFPSDTDLAREQGVGVASIRTALKRLESYGLIQRERGSTRVISGEVRAAYDLAGAPGSGGGAYSANTELALDRRRRLAADAELAFLLGVAEGSPWLHLSGLRRTDEEQFGPLSWVDLWLDPDAGVAGDTAAGAALLMLAQHCAECVESYSAAQLTPAHARVLRARSGGAALTLLRRYLRANGTVLGAIRDVHPAERAAITVRTAKA